MYYYIFKIICIIVICIPVAGQLACVFKTSYSLREFYRYGGGRLLTTTYYYIRPSCACVEKPPTNGLFTIDEFICKFLYASTRGFICVHVVFISSTESLQL
jgi:hypothetical protein